MKDWETRLMDEHEDLEGKIERLSNFLDENPDNEDYDLLMEQLEYMKGYFSILCKRIQQIKDR